MFNKIIIDDIDYLVACAIEDINNGEVELVSFIAKYEEAVAIIKAILQYDETSIDFISLFSDGLEDYFGKEYLITLDNNWVMWCDEIFDKEIDDYIYYETDKIYIMNDCDINCTNAYDESKINIVLYEDELNDINKNQMVHDKNKNTEDSNCKFTIFNNSDGYGISISNFDDNNNFYSLTYLSDSELTPEEINYILNQWNF